MKLGELSAKKRTVVLDYDGDTVEIEYVPAKVTMELQARIEAAQSLAGAQGNEELAKILTEVLVSWDLLDDDGKRLPVTMEMLMALPLRFVTVLTMGIFGDIRPNLQTGKR